MCLQTSICVVLRLQNVHPLDLARFGTEFFREEREVGVQSKRSDDACDEKMKKVSKENLLTLSSTGFCGKFLLAMRDVCWRLHWSREENLDWYSDQRWSTS